MFQRLRVVGQNLGFVPRRRGKSLLVWGGNLDSFARSEPIVSELSRRYPRLNFYRVSPSSTVRSQLAADNPASEILAPPARFDPCLRLYLARCKAQVLLLTDEVDDMAVQVVGFAAAQGVAVAAVQPPGSRGHSIEALVPGGRLFLVDLFITFDETDAEALHRLRVAPTKVLHWDTNEAAGNAALVAAFQPLIVAERDRPKRGARSRGYPAVRLAATLGSMLLSPIVRWKYRRIATLGALREELGRPDTILCLGNGPSSEDPRLADLEYDALFRVNHSWRSRGFLTEPQMVFTGLRATVAAVRGPTVFAFQTRRAEQRLLLKCLPVPRRVTYTTAESLGVVDFGGFGGYVPTNGAVMLATAVALHPKRLIVAGIDLFQHPEGSYPGDSETPNAYTILHDRERELQFILTTLERHAGELTIVSEVLDGYWRAHKNPRFEQEASSVV